MIEIKSARDILHKNGFTAQIGEENTEFVVEFDDALEAMKEYAAQFIELAAEKALVEANKDNKTEITKKAYPHFDGWEILVNKESILKLKEQIK